MKPRRSASAIRRCTFTKRYGWPGPRLGPHNAAHDRPRCKPGATGVFDVIDVARQFARGVQPGNRPNLLVQHLGQAVSLQAAEREGDATGHRLGADEAEHHDDEGADHGRPALGREATVLGHQGVGADDFTVWQPAHQRGEAQADEAKNCRDHEDGEPELEFTVLGHAEQVGARQRGS